MLINQQQKPSKTLQECVQRVLDLLLKSSRLLPNQAKDLAHITHSIRNLHTQKLQDHVLDINLTSFKKIITLAQKKDAELRIIEGLQNHDSGNKFNNIYTKHNDKPIYIGPCHASNGPHLIKNCNESICGRCKPNPDNHTPSRCPRKCPFSKHQSSSTSHSNDNSNRTKINIYTKPNL